MTSPDEHLCCPPAATCPPPADAAVADQQLAALAKAVAHPTRVAILRLLRATDGCVVGELVGRLPLAQSTISQHLKQMREAGLVRGEIDGPRTCYCVEPAALARLKSLITEL
jgi:DNA-binding transcriptional ArsR family regulator